MPDFFGVGGGDSGVAPQSWDISVNSLLISAFEVIVGSHEVTCSVVKAMLGFVGSLNHVDGMVL